jgi:hypothetical protein
VLIIEESNWHYASPYDFGMSSAVGTDYSTANYITPQKIVLVVNVVFEVN